MSPGAAVLLPLANGTAVGWGALVIGLLTHIGPDSSKPGTTRIRVALKGLEQGLLAGCQGWDSANLLLLFKRHYSSVAARPAAGRGMAAVWRLMAPGWLLSSGTSCRKVAPPVMPGAANMRIVADENMPLVEELFSSFGEVVRLPGRQLQAGDVRDADVLLVRSVTRVNRELVEGSRIRFVGTATIGTDHIDLLAMEDMGITVASAPGCNARAVAEYVLTCLLVMAEEQDWQPHQRHVGVAGLGNVGRQVVALLGAAGFRVSGCDPLLASGEVPEVPRLTLDEMVDQCDILCLHTPLTRTGPHPTWHMVDEGRLARMRPGQILLNAGRGEVIDNVALVQRLQQPDAPVTILDVWEGEPRVMPELLAQVRLGSPHVAGYSQQGKWRGTAMIQEAFCRFANLQPAVKLDDLVLPAGPVLSCPLADSPVQVAASICRELCQVDRDDRALRASLLEAAPAQAFDRLRRDYPPRFEFASCTIKGPVKPEWLPVLQALGLQVTVD